MFHKLTFRIRQHSLHIQKHKYLSFPKKLRQKTT